MALCLVFVEYASGRFRKCMVDGGKPFGYILMYRALADSEVFGGLSDGSTGFHDIIGYFDCPVFNLLMF